MKHVLIIAAMTFGLAGLTGATPAAAASRNFDCSKPANANKTACKPATHVAAPAAKAKVATKAASKSAAPKAKPTIVAAAKPAAKPAARQVTTTQVARNYDCAKAGNANKQQCKTGAARTTVASVTPAPRPAAARPAAARPAAPARRAAAAATSSDNQVAAGAIARCKDGMYSHAARRDGACSRHGGVGTWLTR